ncbi:hypothetical protein HGB07_07730, partial [Candidatus Roizmanbacteria bacterium]|nr:hypothetical protein [Candidatus Roizmanbacteria bacterium]
MNQVDSGADFLIKRFPMLSSTPEVNKAIQREGLTVQAAPRTPEAKVQTYLDRFNEIFGRKDAQKKARGITALKALLVDRYVVRVEDVPESYQNAQLRKIRDRGELGDWKDLPEEEALKREQDHLTQTKEDQKGSLEEWVDYLASEKSAYLPDYLKYWAFAGMLKLERYEKAKKNEQGITIKQGRFPERPSGKQRSIKMFPEVNENGLKFIANAYKQLAADQDVYWGYNHDIPKETRQSFLDALKRKDFRDAYGWIQEHIPPITDEELRITEGENCGWVTFSKAQGHTGHDVAETLTGKGTGWCIAGSDTAQGNYLDEGAELHIYYTRDLGGNQANPRVVIVSRGNQVYEVRGIEWEENIDEYMKASDITGKKLQELPGGEEFFETDADTKQLSTIDRKMSKGEQLTSSEIVFLYEIKEPIRYFGYRKDPRIEELREKRDLKEDGLIVKQQLSEYPMGKVFLEEAADALHLIEIEDKIQNGISLDSSDIFFLYAGNKPVHGISVPRQNARIKELREKRNSNDDAPIVLGCEPSQVAHNLGELRSDTKAYIGPLLPEICEKLQEATNIKHIYALFPEGKVTQLRSVKVGGKTKEQLLAVFENAFINSTSIATLQETMFSFVQDTMSSSDFTTLPKVQ